ncbi:alpha-hydroxy acid oxidase [Actinoplanes palleronii]|uniref:Alpha-hydroxy-acid oxidizing enzyme n=1 Tax=Actinoplanes palleronii TaxID=113570 RepID=A0ABQ4BIW6_9ACTN|nr:alpha-hydroxy acid oxidase [Actinoplanes palleronii]GIE70627.1 alpha-hydroxy-acid oxidizing enzyme [Actinoplanes palleronii]
MPDPDGQAVEVLSLADVAAAAKAVTSAAVWDFIEGGSGVERSLRANRAGLDAVYVLPRILRDVSRQSAAGVLLGSPVSMPVVTAPMAYQRLVNAEGELAAARAAKVADVPFTVSMLSSVSVEELAAAGGTLWFQLYWLRDRAVTLELLERAEAAGCQALMLTVDVPRMGRRLRDVRNGFTLPPGVTAVHLGGPETSAHRWQSGASAVAAHTQQIFDPTLSWSDLGWLRERTTMPLIVKGVLDPNDAARAAGAGVAGLVVSNHGGRQLDGSAAGIDVLPKIREAVDGRCQVYLDGGIRGGGDVLGALARGADAVLLGRPILWGLAAAGERGVNDVLSLLREEFDHAMILAGCRDLADVRQLQVVDSRAPMR